MTRLLILAALLLAAPAAQAADARCRAVVNGSEVVIDFDSRGTAITRRERVMGWPGRVWNYAWGSPPACNSDVLVGYLSAMLEADDIDAYCLAQTSDEGFLLVPGERNFRGRCRMSTCEYVNAGTDEALAVAGDLGRMALGRRVDGRGEVVSHVSGALIATGTLDYVLGAVGSAGTAVAGALGAPAVVAASAVSVVAVGGAVYVCRD